MDWSRMLALILAVSLTSRANAEVNLREGCAVRFASVDEGAEILGRKDDFIQRLSAFDRAARMKTDRSISQDEFLKFVKGNVLTWNESEKAKIEAAIASIRPALDALPLSLPKIVNLVKTTGAEEGRSFYTRDTAIVMPEKATDEADAGLLKKTIAHELFHILSRGNPSLRENSTNRLASRNAVKSSFRLTSNRARSLIPTRRGTITRSRFVSVEKKCARCQFYFQMRRNMMSIAAPSSSIIYN
jgi:hypothetical protein